VVDTQANAARLAGAKHLLDLDLKVLGWRP
jgi:hypothetical protein